MEAIIAFSDYFVKEIQSDQRVRYNQLMRAFTMSAAETARKTREFRSPPQDQVRAREECGCVCVCVFIAVMSVEFE